MIKVIVVYLVLTFIVSAFVFVSDVLKWHKAEKRIESSPSALSSEPVSAAELSDRSPFDNDDKGVNEDA